MHIELHPRFADSPPALKARDLTSACVHCGFCLATCPTYLDGRDERDSPRGRIYLIKQLLESGEASQPTQRHLDRCLTCRNCETTCPSGMQYGELLDIGRGLMEVEARRPAREKIVRWLLRAVLPRPHLLATALALAQNLRFALPHRWRQKIPPRQSPGAVPLARHNRRMLALAGCVQQVATPATTAAAQRVLDKLGISLSVAPAAGCCGALDYHLAAHEDGLDRMRHNIDTWWPHLEEGIEAIVSSASGCGAQLKDYGRLLAHDPDYASRALRVSQLSKDLGEILLEEDLTPLSANTRIGAVAVHTPCTLQHALQQPELVRRILARAGFEISVCTGEGQCCGSAGTYSILQPSISTRLRDKTLRDLSSENPQLIATANIGCQLHLQSGTEMRVAHWIELLDHR